MEEKKIFEISLKENLIKNAAVIIILLMLYSQVHGALKSVDSTKMGHFLLIISIFLVIVCFANFAFSYDILILKSFGMRVLSHFATFLFMLLLGFLLEALTIAVSFVYPSLAIMIAVFSILLYIGLALHDFWDFFKAFHKNECA